MPRNDSRAEIGSSGGATGPAYRCRAASLPWVALATLIACGGGNGLPTEPQPIVTCEAPTDSRRPPITAPLQVHPANPRYFVDARGDAVFLTGSHNWGTVQFSDEWGPPVPEYEGFLDCLEAWDHNFIRLWVWEDTQHPPTLYRRTGPGRALDGEAKFDLRQLNDVYFDVLAERVRIAQDRGFYVSVMLFQGWSIEAKTDGREVWSLHPYNAANNVNGIDGDLDSNGDGEEVHTLAAPAITALQEAYVRRVMDAVGEFDNVLYEISNESHGSSQDWQYHFIRFIKTHEAAEPKQHPVGMTVEWPRGSNDDLFASPADWVSPNSTEQEPYRSDPPPATGDKIIVTDSDHLWGLDPASVDWVWKSFVRGLHPIHMDPMTDDSLRIAVRLAMGHARQVARTLDLALLQPAGHRASTGYALADEVDGRNFLVYLPEGGDATVDLNSTPGTFDALWMHAVSGDTASAGTVEGGAARRLQAPFDAPAVLHLKRRDPPANSPG